MGWGGWQDPTGAELQTVLSPVCPRLHELPFLKVSGARWHMQHCGTADELCARFLQLRAVLCDPLPVSTLTCNR